MKKILLFPLACIYAIIVSIRNSFFNWGILSQKEFDIPVICIGNLAVGGTGKTPHTELLINLLKTNYKVATLSRGYKRKTKGFLLADENSTAASIGDEPFQLKSKFKDIIVAVDEKRRRGIEKLQELTDPDIILLDDAFQHRYVKPGLSILLTDYNHLFTTDCMLPLGRLREPKKNKERADIVIVTKCPKTAQPIDFLLIKKDLNLNASQLLFFSTFEYDDIKPVFPEEMENPMQMQDFKKEESAILLVTGIVSPEQLEEHLSEFSQKVLSLSYPDHYAFTEKDTERILEKFNAIEAPQKAIIVTEKDAARLVGMQLPQQLKASMYSIGIKVSILQDQEEKFNFKILDYVRKNKRNR